jgi:hypothetical protein
MSMHYYSAADEVYVPWGTTPESAMIALREYANKHPNGRQARFLKTWLASAEQDLSFTTKLQALHSRDGPVDILPQLAEILPARKIGLSLIQRTFKDIRSASSSSVTEYRKTLQGLLRAMMSSEQLPISDINNIYELLPQLTKFSPTGETLEFFIDLIEQIEPALLERNGINWFAGHLIANCGDDTGTCHMHHLIHWLTIGIMNRRWMPFMNDKQSFPFWLSQHPGNTCSMRLISHLRDLYPEQLSAMCGVSAAGRATTCPKVWSQSIASQPMSTYHGTMTNIHRGEWHRCQKDVPLVQQLYSHSTLSSDLAMLRTVIESRSFTVRHEPLQVAPRVFLLPAHMHGDGGSQNIHIEYIHALLEPFCEIIFDNMNYLLANSPSISFVSKQKGLVQTVDELGIADIYGCIGGMLRKKNPGNTDFLKNVAPVADKVEMFRLMEPSLLLMVMQYIESRKLLLSDGTASCDWRGQESALGTLAALALSIGDRAIWAVVAVQLVVPDLRLYVGEEERIMALLLTPLFTDLIVNPQHVVDAAMIHKLLEPYTAHVRPSTVVSRLMYAITSIFLELIARPESHGGIGRLPVHVLQNYESEQMQEESAGAPDATPHSTSVAEPSVAPLDSESPHVSAATCSLFVLNINDQEHGARHILKICSMQLQEASMLHTLSRLEDAEDAEYPYRLSLPAINDIKLWGAGSEIEARGSAIQSAEVVRFAHWAGASILTRSALFRTLAIFGVESQTLLSSAGIREWCSDWHRFDQALGGAFTQPPPELKGLYSRIRNLVTLVVGALPQEQ